MGRTWRERVALVQALGTSGCARAALDRVSQHYVVLSRDLGLGIPEPRFSIDLQWEDLGSDIETIAAANPVMTRDEARRRLDHGQRCRVARHGAICAHCFWLAGSQEDLPYLGKRLDVGPGGVILCAVFTHPAYRGRGIGENSVLWALRQAREAGYREVVALVSLWNRPSQRMMARARYRKVGAVGVVGMGLLRRYYSAGDARLDSDGTITLASASSPARRADNG